jgi:elongation factor 2
MYLINLIDVPGHSDLPAQATDVLCMADGTLIIADCGEGFKVHPESLIHHALRERVRHVLCLTNIDAYFTDSQVSREELYHILLRNIKEINDKLGCCDKEINDKLGCCDKEINDKLRCRDKLLGDVQVYPQKGSIAFSSSLCGWGFTLPTIAKHSAHHEGIDESQVLELIWGDWFFDSETHEWTSKHTGNVTCKRGFVKFFYEPIKDIINICMSNDKSRLHSTLDHHGLILKEKEVQLEGEDMLKYVMK